MLAHIMKYSKVSSTAFLGGISTNYQSNLIQTGDGAMIIAEADEFDRSFLELSPNIACITSMDADHLDIYGDAEALQKSFRDFAAQVKEDGVLFVKNGLPLDGITVGVEDHSAYAALNVKIENIKLQIKKRLIKKLILKS